MQRLFISPDSIKGKIVNLGNDAAYRLHKVMRMAVGDEVIILDNTGKERLVRITSLNHRQGEGEIVSTLECLREPKSRITLCQGVLKGKKFDWVLQKGTELGIHTFIPILCERSVPIWGTGAFDSRLPRLQKIIVEASEQSGRSVLPNLGTPRSFEDMCLAIRGKGLGLIPWEGSSGSNLKDVLKKSELTNVYIFIGPEGGFTRSEVVFAEENDIRVVTLGRLILRAETAGLIASTAVLYEADQLKS